MTRNTCIDVIVPVYKNASMTRDCLDSLWPELDLLRELTPRVILVNDSPHDLDVRALFGELNPSNALILHTNEENLGFVKTVNIGLTLSRERQAHSILLNTDTIIFPGALVEMMRVAQTDPMIGFVSPRSNNASICTLPHLQSPGGSPVAYYEQFQRVARLMPDKTYSPTAVGFCMFVNVAIVANFGLLDWAFGHGYEEENDLVLRANKVGFCAVIANHAFVYHYGSVSFSLLDSGLTNEKSSNMRLLLQRHPEFIPAVTDYMRSPQFEAEALISAYAETDTRPAVLFDLSSIGDTRHGTSSYAAKVIKAFATRCAARFRVFVRCSDKAFEALGLSNQLGIRRSSLGDKRSFALGVRLSQPFRVGDLAAFEHCSVNTVYAMLDTIAYDCLHLRANDPLRVLWQYVGDHANGIIYISAFAQAQFRNRFRVSPDAFEFASLLSTDVGDYRPREGSVETTMAGRHILVVGNHFRHKDTAETTRRIEARFQNVRIVVLGTTDAPRPFVSTYASGGLTDEQLDDLYADASVVVLPSFYEGFGMGLMHAIALNKRIVVREGPATDEILAHFPSHTGVVTFSDPDQMIRALQAVLDGPDPVFEPGDVTVSWNNLADHYADLFTRIIEAPNTYDRMLARLEKLELLRTADISPTPIVWYRPDAPDTPDAPDARQNDSTPHQASHLPQIAAPARVHELTSCDRDADQITARETVIRDEDYYLLAKSTLWYSIFSRFDRFATQHPTAYRRLAGLVGAGRGRADPPRGEADSFR